MTVSQFKEGDRSKRVISRFIEMMERESASPINDEESDDFDNIRKNLIDDINDDVLQSSGAENAQVTTQVKDDESSVSPLSERIKVYLRIRPFTEQERSAALDESCISVENEHSVVLVPPRQSHAFRASMYGVSRQQHRFLFNRVFKEDTTQMQFFDEAVKDTITEFIGGQRCLIFSYGVTNSGKTYTMQGDTRSEGAGIIPRSLNQLFSMISSSQVTGIHFKPIMFGDVARLTADQIEREEKLKESLFRQPLVGSISNVALTEVGPTGKDAAFGDDTFADCENVMSDDSLESRLSIVSDIKYIGSRMRYTVWVSFLEIYNEQLYDLLVPLPLTNTKPVRRTVLQLRDDREGRPYVLGLREVNVMCAEEALKLMEIGRRNLHIASTRLNRTSSRSHCIFTLKLVQLVDVEKPSVARVSSLSFCDLAGSERYQASCAFNDRVKEAGNINSSLLTLGRCIEALKRNQSRREQSLSIPPTPRATVESLTQANTPQFRRGDSQMTIAPFRESKLTRIIQNFMCGEGRVSMIVNISQCLNVFDETLHALKYSALAREVIIAPVVPSSLPRQIQSNSAQKPLTKRHTSASLNISRSVCKKRKTEDLQPIAECLDAQPCAESDKCNEVDENDQESGDEYVDAEDTSRESHPTGWKEQRENMIAMIKKLECLLNEERINSYAREVRIRQEVCSEMQKQMVRIENDYQEGLRAHEEICEDKYERKMEIYKDAIQKSCKRLRPADSAAHSYRTRDLELTNEELEKQVADLQKQVADLRVSFKTVSDERDSYIQRLTKAEIMASNAGKKLELLQSEAGDILTHAVSDPKMGEKTIDSSLLTRVNELETELSEERLKNTRNNKDLGDEIEQLMVKMKDMEQMHDSMCQQLRVELMSKQNEVSANNEKEKSTLTKFSQCELELEQMKSNFASAEESLITLQAELIDMKNRLATVQDEKDIVERKLKDVNDELAVSRSELVTCKRKYEEDLKETRIDLESKLDEALKERHELNCIESEIDQAKFKLLAAENKLTNCVADLQKAQSDVSQKEDELSRLDSELKIAQETSKQQEKLVTDLSRKLADAELQMKSDQDNFSAKFAKHQKELQDLEQKFSFEKKCKSEVDAELKTMECELETSARNLASLTCEMSVMKDQILKGDEREQKLKAQFNASAQLVKELQGKIEQISASSEEGQAAIKQKLQDQYELKINHLESELSAKEQKLQARYQTINDLVEKMEKEHAAYEIALRDAKSNESVIEQLKLTLSEQELTMQAQDRVINDRDLKVKSLEDSITRLHTEYDSVMAQLSADSKRHELELSRQIESNQGQVKEKDGRIKELEKEIKKFERQKLSLEKDVCDLTSELKDCERKLTERSRELSSCQLEVERLKSSKEVDTKSMAKDLIQRGADLLSLKQQLAASEELCKSQCDELKRIREQCDDSKKMLERKEKELKKWRHDRDVVAADLQKLICDKDAQIKLLQETARSNAKESEDLESLKRALNIKHQAIEDLREQNLQLQKMIGENPSSIQQTAGSKSKRSRGPLRVTDHNADLSMSILSEGHHAVDLDEGSARSRKVPKKSVGDVALSNENSVEVANGPKGRRARHCNVTDEKMVIPESPLAARPAARELRSRRAV